MQVVFDTSASNSTAAAASVAVTMSVAAGNARILIVAIAFDSTARSVTSISGHGASWQPAAFGKFSDGGTGGGNLELWYGLMPATGSATVTVNFDTSAAAAVQVFSFREVNQASPLFGYNSQHATSNPFSLNLNVQSGDAGLASFISAQECLGSAAGCDNGANDPTDSAPSARWSGGGHFLANKALLTLGFTNPAANAGMQLVGIRQVNVTFKNNLRPRPFAPGLAR